MANALDTASGDGVVRVVLTADNHLSASLPRLSPTRVSERRQRLQQAFVAAVDGAIGRHAHLFLHAGDLFDTVEPRNRDRAFVAKSLARLRAAGIQTYAVSGNHDTPRQRASQGGVAPQVVYSQLGGLHYFAGQHTLNPVAVTTSGVQLAMVGLSSDPTAPPGADPLDNLAVHDPSGILSGSTLGILLLHAAIEGYCFPSEVESMVRRSSLAALAGIHVVLAGHVHAFTQATVGGKSVVVCGATENMEFGHAEDAPGYAYIELTRTGLRHVEHVPIMPQPRHVVTVAVSELWPQSQPPSEPAEMPANESDGIEAANARPIPAPVSEVGGNAMATPVDSPIDGIIARLAPVCTAEAQVRLVMEGPVTRDQYHALDLRRLWLYGHQRAFFFEIDESGLTLVSERGQDVVARGERIAPRSMLDHIFRERLVSAETPEMRSLVLRTRDRVLTEYDELVGTEEGR